MNQMQIIKRELENHIGKKVIVRANKGRKKIVTRKGILKATYPSLFVLEVFNGEELVNASYTYSDVLTSTVQVTVLDEDVTYKDAKMIS
ncbi:Veg family protein [Peptoniphilus sp.]|uniref:Veg family protein n=1 Tax=Peptoniphilus sp. TaxID=1971214 RepID=UPI0039942A2A